MHATSHLSSTSSRERGNSFRSNERRWKTDPGLSTGTCNAQLYVWCGHLPDKPYIWLLGLSGEVFCIWMNTSWLYHAGGPRAKEQTTQMCLHQMSVLAFVFPEAAPAQDGEGFSSVREQRQHVKHGISGASATVNDRSSEEAPFSELTPLIWISKHDVKRWLKANYSSRQWKVN